MPRLSTLKAVIPTLMAELTAWSVACPAAVPYLRHRSDRTTDKDENGGDRAFGGSIGKDYKEIMLCATKITPMHVLSLKPSNFWQLERKITLVKIVIS